MVWLPALCKSIVEIIYDKAVLPGPFEIGFHRFIRDLSAPTPRQSLVADIYHVERIQKPTTNLTAGIRHLLAAATTLG